jgi:hypothetical protein
LSILPKSAGIAVNEQPDKDVYECFAPGEGQTDLDTARFGGTFASQKILKQCIDFLTSVRLLFAYQRDDGTCLIVGGSRANVDSFLNSMRTGWSVKSCKVLAK